MGSYTTTADLTTRYLVESAVDVWDTTTLEWVNWAAGMVKAEPAIGNYIDGIAIHPYPGAHDPYYEPKGGTDESFKNTDLIYKKWTELGINRPIWLTETGYSSCLNKERCVPGATQAEREAKKAEWLAGLFEELGENQYGYVHAVYLYNFRQWLAASEPTSTQSDWFGIVDGEGKHLPAWGSFATAVEKYSGTPVPDTTIISHAIEGGSASFTFSDTDSTASLECQLDAGSWVACASPKSYSKLTVGTHAFHVRATNAEVTEPSPASYEWSVAPSPLEAMPVTEPFNGGSSPISNFSTNWSALGWATSSSPKGEDTSSGWTATTSLSGANSGAFYSPTITDTGAGNAVVATMVHGPGVGSRYVSLWLDMPGPSGTRAGYELRFTKGLVIGSSVYNVTLSKWQGGVRTILASRSEYTFSAGNSFALVKKGGQVSAWTNSGSGFEQLLSAGDTTFGGGSAGVEGSGATTLINFRVGALLAPVSGVDAALTALTLNDSFAINESPLSGGGAWSALNWDTSTSGHNTGRVEGGWGPYDAYSSINGAYWQKSSFADTGAGDAVAATLSHNPGSASRYFSLWLNMPGPASIRSGYELRFTETSSGVYEVAILRWQSGIKTVLTSKTGYSFPVGSQFALVDKAGIVSAWTKTGSEYVQLLSVSDATFTSGYTGIEGSGNITRLTNFRSGPLAPF